MTPEASAIIGNITIAVIFLVVVFTVIGVLTTLYFGWEFKMALLGKAYRPTLILISAGLVVIGIAVWIL